MQLAHLALFLDRPVAELQLAVRHMVLVLVTAKSSSHLAAGLWSAGRLGLVLVQGWWCLHAAYRERNEKGVKPLLLVEIVADTILCRALINGAISKMIIIKNGKN